jgi:hypothetical protein
MLSCALSLRKCRTTSSDGVTKCKASRRALLGSTALTLTLPDMAWSSGPVASEGSTAVVGKRKLAPGLEISEVSQNFC